MEVATRKNDKAGSSQIIAKPFMQWFKPVLCVMLTKKI